MNESQEFSEINIYNLNTQISRFLSQNKDISIIALSHASYLGNHTAILIFKRQ